MLSKVDSAGTHRKHGLFAARGMGIAPGRLLRNPKLVDIAPTLLGLAGVSIPDDLDGAVITEVMSGRSVMGSVVRNRTAEVSREAPADPYTEDDRRTLEQRLRSLGYLE
jgi:arylsulfatase A-like enzyme